MAKLLSQEEVYRHALDEGVRHKRPVEKLYLKHYYSDKFSKFPDEVQQILIYWANHKARKLALKPMRVFWPTVVITMIISLVLTKAALPIIIAFAILCALGLIMPFTGWFKQTCHKLAYYEIVRFLEVVPPPGQKVMLTEFGQS